MSAQTTKTTELPRTQIIAKHMRAAFEVAPLSENEATVEALIEAIQALEASGDLAALNQANIMLGGAIQRVSTALILSRV